MPEVGEFWIHHQTQRKVEIITVFATGELTWKAEAIDAVGHTLLITSEGGWYQES